MTRLEQLRLDAGLTRSQLGKAANVTHGTIASLEERRTNRPQVRTLTQLAEFFGVRPSELCVQASSVSPLGPVTKRSSVSVMSVKPPLTFTRP